MVIANKLLKLVMLSFLVAACSTHSDSQKIITDDPYFSSAVETSDEDIILLPMPECPDGLMRKAYTAYSTSAEVDGQTITGSRIEYACVEDDETNQ